MAKVSIEVAQRAKAKAHLADLVRYNNVVMKREEMVRCCLDKGLLPDTRLFPRIKDMSRRAYNRATNAEQYEHQKRQREAGNKTVYVMYRKHDTVFVGVTKTQYSHALATLFLDWCNNFLSVEKFAEHYGVDVDTAETWIAEGKKFHEFMAGNGGAE